VTGDYNGDGSVDAADYVVWRKSQIGGQAGYTAWRANFGRSAGGLGTAGSVPEPASGVLLVVALVGVLLRQARVPMRV
jgi:hypothetical protein